jgi:hypothetical protein
MSRLRREYQGVPEAQRNLLTRHERVAALVTLAFIGFYAVIDRVVALMVPTDQQFIARVALVAAGGLSTMFVAVRVMLNQSARQMREHEEAREREEAARLDGVLLAANTLQHYVRNQLTVTAGQNELLARDPRLPDELRPQAQAAMQGAFAAAETVGTLQRAAELGHIPPLLEQHQDFAILDLDAYRDEEEEPPP